MAAYRLTACSTADRSPAFFRDREIPYAAFHYHEGDVVRDDDLGQSIPFEEFYAAMAAGAQPQTSQPSGGDYARVWEPILEAGEDVVHLSLSSGISGAYEMACAAATEIVQAHPGRAIHVVDSLCASGGYGMLLELMADERDRGVDAEGLVAFAERTRLHVNHWFFSTDLTAYVRGGRVSAPAAWAAAALSICPVLTMDAKGCLVPQRKVRTRTRAAKAVVGEMEARATDGTDYDGPCGISHSACPEMAELVRDLVEDSFPRLEGRVWIESVGTVIGSHAGPGTVALYFLGEERS